MATRSVIAVKTTAREHIGDLETRNALGETIDPAFDPFLILGHHGPQRFAPGNHGMPFTDHPHRGFETVTFILEGALVHTDSGGHRQTVERGGVQWMTAGAGVIHNEQVPPAFFRDGGTLEIIQLWVNLPARLKMTPASYIGIQAQGVPAVPMPEGVGTMHLVSGSYAGHDGPIVSLTGVFMSWIDLAANSRVYLPAPAGRTVLLYVVRGAVAVDGRPVRGGDLVRMADDGDTVAVAAASDATILFGHAEPICEPVVSRGPFVMNTGAEIEQAFRDYRAGAFGAPPAIAEID